MNLPPLFASLPAAFAAAYDPAAPWDLLGDALDNVLDALPSAALASRLSPDVHLLGDQIVIGKGCRIGPGAVLEGPIFVGDDVEIRAGAYLRGGVWLGDGAIVGASTEIKRAIFLPGARAPHLNYVGDSILGAGVNLGTGTVLSNFRHDGREINIPGAPFAPHGDDPGAVEVALIAHHATRRRKLGAVLGDGVLTGCNAVLHPGTVVGRQTQIYPGVLLRAGIYPQRSVIKLRQDIELVALQS